MTTDQGGLPGTTRRGALAGALSVAMAGRSAAAENWPTRPLRLIVPFAAGGTADLVARLVAERLGPALGQNVVVENRLGGGGTLGAAAVAQAPPDGYTLLWGTPGAQTTNPFMMAKLPYDWANGFTPVVNVMRTPNLLVVAPAVPADKLADLIRLAKEKPGTLTFGSAGVGSTSHLAGELLRSLAGIDIVHVPFRGTSATIQALLSGDIHMTLDGLPALLPFVRDGKLKLLGATTPTRSPILPDTPALAETLPGFDAAPFNYIAGPAGLPASVVERINAATNAILVDPGFLDRFRQLGFEATGGTPGELAAIIKAEAARWKVIIETFKIRIE